MNDTKQEGIDKFHFSISTGTYQFQLLSEEMMF